MSTQPTKPSKAKMSRKKQKFVDTFVATGVGSEAARQAFDIDPDNKHLAAVMASEYLAKPDIRDAIEERLSDERLEKKHSDLIDAVTLEQLYFDIYDTDEDIEKVIGSMPGFKLLHIVRRLSKEGEVMSVYAYVSAPNSLVQDKALDKAYKLKGKYAPEGRVNVNIDANSTERTRELGSRLVGLLRRGNKPSV